MAGYIISVITMGAIGSILAMSLPRDGGSSQYVRYISQLTVLLVLLAPIGKLSPLLSSFAVTVPQSNSIEESGGEEAVISKSAENISLYITEICGSLFSLETDNIKIRMILDDTDPENVIIEEIQIFTSESDAYKRAEVKKYFEETLLTEVYVFGP